MARRHSADLAPAEPEEIAAQVASEPDRQQKHVACNVLVQAVVWDDGRRIEYRRKARE